MTSTASSSITSTDSTFSPVLPRSSCRISPSILRIGRDTSMGRILTSFRSLRTNMQISNMRWHSILGLVAIAAFAGCGEPQTPIATASQQNAPIARESAHGRSWMLPEAKSEDLLYVSNVYTITVYSYPKGKLVGTLNNFEKPYGECVDAKGNVWITDSSFGKIYEYAHGGTKPIHTVKDPEYVPYGCAVDPTTGDLAVANYSDASDREGNVAVYHKAKGT